MQKKVVVVIILILSLLSGCSSPGGVRSDGGGGNNDNSNAVVGALLLIGAGLVWKNRDSIFKKSSKTNDPFDTSVPTNIKSTNYRYVYDHTYTPVTSLGNEKSGYGLYTYVLLNKKINIEGSALIEYRKKAKIILEMVQTYLPSANISYIDFSKINNFVIPTTSKSTTNVTLENYSYTLSKNFLSDISTTLSVYNNKSMSNTFKKHPGPFLITTLKPISKTGDALYFLYVDMSSLKPSAIQEVMQTYTNKLENSESGNMPFTKLETLRLNALKHLVGFNNIIAVVKQSLLGG